MAVEWIHPKVLRIARNYRLVDRPDDRKLQREPVPVLGGIAVAFGIFAGVMVALLSGMLTGGPIPSAGTALFVSMVVMLFVGAIDDMMDLSAAFRFFIQIVVTLSLIYGSGICIDSLHGLWGVGEYSWQVAVPLTVFASVGVINAINMIDGVNGLCSSLCLIYNLLFGCVFVSSGLYAVALVNFVMAASLIPFLIHNVVGIRSKMFIGDSGTMVMGVLMSYDTIVLLSKDSHMAWCQASELYNGLVTLSVAILAVPVADTLRVMTMRMVHGTSPFKADKTHLHHILMDYTHSHSITTTIEVLIALLIDATWLITYWLRTGMEWQFYAVLLVSMLLVWGLYAYLAVRRKVRTGMAWKLRCLFAQLRQGNTQWWMHLQELVDRKC